MKKSKNFKKNSKKSKKILFSAAISSIFAIILLFFEFLPSGQGVPASTSPQQLSLPNLSLYYLTLSKSQVETSAVSLAIDQQAQGHAGYVKFINENYYTVSGVFENENDAVMVKNTLKNNGQESEIIKINLTGFIVEGQYDVEQKKVLSRVIKASYETYLELFDISISLDTNVYNEISARLAVNNCHSVLSGALLDLNTIFEEKDEFILSLIDHLEDVNKTVELLCSGILINPLQTYSSLIKYRYCEVLENLTEFMKNTQKT